MRLIAQAPGKLILLGEYAVLEGAPALVAAVDRSARVKIQPRQQPYSLLNVPTLGVSDLPFRVDEQGRLRFKKEVDLVLLKKLSLIVHTFEFGNSISNKKAGKLPPADITLEISDFYLDQGKTKLGLGSSAAQTVALLAALLHFDDTSPLDRFELLQKAIKAHSLAQGNLGSGVDVAASALGGILKYRIPKKGTTIPTELERLMLPEGLHMQFIWTGKSAATRKLLQQLYRFKRESPTAYQKLMKELVRLSSAGCDAFSREEIGKFLAAVEKYYQTLLLLSKKSHAPIISTDHLKLAKVVYGCGGFYKPSGAGEGDFGIAFSNSVEIIEKLTMEVIEAGFKIMKLNTGVSGVHLKVNES